MARYYFIYLVLTLHNIMCQPPLHVTVSQNYFLSACHMEVLIKENMVLSCYIVYLFKMHWNSILLEKIVVHNHAWFYIFGLSLTGFESFRWSSRSITFLKAQVLYSHWDHWQHRISWQVIFSLLASKSSFMPSGFENDSTMYSFSRFDYETKLKERM